MGEPLFDAISAAIVVLGTAAMAFIRSANDTLINSRRRARGNFVGHLLLGLATGLLLYRWVESVTSLPAEVQPSFWRSSSLSVACGIGLIAAFKSVTAPATRIRCQYFVISAISVAIALMVASAWDWALLLLVILACGLALALRNSEQCTDVSASKDEANEQREPALVAFFSAALLLLLLGTWQHVTHGETQRQTRSPRYSAWPRPTALRDAWERTGWSAKPGDAESSELVDRVYFGEQRIAMSLGALLLIVTLLPRTLVRRQQSELNHAS